MKLKWIEWYNIAKEYYEEHGNLLVSSNYVLEKNGTKYNLGSWIVTQRRLYENEKLSDEKTSALNGIGMVWSCRLFNWKEWYNVAKEYYEEHGDLLVPFNYVVEKNSTKYNLGSWIVTQRRLYENEKLSDEKTSALNGIGMVWNVKTYKRICKEIDYQYHLYQLGAYDSRNVCDKLHSGKFKYSDDGTISKGSAAMLTYKTTRRKGIDT